MLVGGNGVMVLEGGRDTCATNPATASIASRPLFSSWSQSKEKELRVSHDKVRAALAIGAHRGGVR